MFTEAYLYGWEGHAPVHLLNPQASKVTGHRFPMCFNRFTLLKWLVVALPTPLKTSLAF